MAIIQKSSFAQHLEVYPVLITDTAEFSKYFKVSQIPDTFTGGKNAFLVQGTPYLEIDTYLMIEIKDAKGQVIYSEPAGGSPSDYYEGVSKPVSVHVYEDTAYGLATLTILGELKEYDLNGVTYPIPDNWKGRPNVRWQRKINVNPTLANTTPIRFYKRPKIKIEEKLFPIYSVQNSIEDVNGYVDGLSVIPADNSRYPYNGTTKYSIRSVNPQTDITFNRGVTNTYPNQPATIFSGSYIGRTLSITNAVDNYNQPYNPNTFSPKIISLIDNKSAYVDTSFLITDGIRDYYSNFTLATFSGSILKSQLTDTGVSQSYMNMRLVDLDTFSGDVYRVKVWAKSKSTLDGYRLIEDRLVEPVELLQKDIWKNTLNFNYGFFNGEYFVENLAENWLIVPTADGYKQAITDYPEYIKIWPSNTNSFKFEPVVTSSFTDRTEYQLSFDTIFSASVPNEIGIMNVYVSGSLEGTGSPFINTDDTLGKKILSLNVSDNFRKFDKQIVNFKADNNTDGSGKITFNVTSGSWFLGNISLKPVKQSSFSPNEISFLTNPNISVVSESFDFRVELFDINYNYVPVKLETSASFLGGNNLTKQLNINYTVPPTFSVSGDGSTVSPAYINVAYNAIQLFDDIIFYSASQQDSPAGILGAGAYSRGNQLFTMQTDPSNPSKKRWLNDGYWYPGTLELYPDPNTSYGQSGLVRVTWENFSSSVRDSIDGNYETITTSSNGVEQTIVVPLVVGHIDYVATCEGLQNTFSIYADYSGVTTTTTTTTTSTTTTTTTTTSTTTTTTTAGPVGPGNALIEIKNNLNPGTNPRITQFIIDSVEKFPDSITSFPLNGLPIKPLESATVITPCVSGDAIVIGVVISGSTHSGQSLNLAFNNSTMTGTVLRSIPMDPTRDVDYGDGVLYVFSPSITAITGAYANTISLDY